MVSVTLEPGLEPPADARGLTTHERAVRGIAAIMARELGVPVPPAVTVSVYETRRVFEQGPVRDAHVSPARAAELSDFAIGIGKRRQLLLNDEGADRRELSRAGIRNHAALVAARLDLETLGSPRGFTVRHRSEGSLPTDQLAFLMADYLIQRGGFEHEILSHLRSVVP